MTLRTGLDDNEYIDPFTGTSVSTFDWSGGVSDLGSTATTTDFADFGNFNFDSFGFKELERAEESIESSDQAQRSLQGFTGVSTQVTQDEPEILHTEDYYVSGEYIDSGMEALHEAQHENALTTDTTDIMATVMDNAAAMGMDTTVM